MEEVFQRIIEILDSTLSTATEASSSNLRNNDLSDFDLGEFV